MDKMKLHSINKVDDHVEKIGKLFPNCITETIAQKKPYYAVFRDSSMANDSVATNFEQIFATYSPSTVRKVL